MPKRTSARTNSPLTLSVRERRIHDLLWNKGLPISEVARILECTPAPIYSLAHRYNWPLNTPLGDGSPAQLTVLKALVGLGYTVSPQAAKDQVSALYRQAPINVERLITGCKNTPRPTP